jgi:hypothetical protein
MQGLCPLLFDVPGGQVGIYQLHEIWRRILFPRIRCIQQLIEILVKAGKKEIKKVRKMRTGKYYSDNG